MLIMVYSKLVHDKGIKKTDIERSDFHILLDLPPKGPAVKTSGELDQITLDVSIEKEIIIAYE